MNKDIYEILKIQNELLEQLVNSWDPVTREKMQKSKDLLEILQNGSKIDTENTVSIRYKSEYYNPNRNF